MGLMGNGGFDGTRRDVHESTAALLRKLMAVPEAQGPAISRGAPDSTHQTCGWRRRAALRPRGWSLV